MLRYPGEVWFLPPEAEEGGDSKGRRHVLLTTCEDSDDIGTFAYASTRPTEARFGAACLFVDPVASRYVPTGFTRPSYVYASRLVPSGSENLVRMTGRLIDQMPRLRWLLHEALGIGTGTADGEGAAAHSWRGKVVRLSRARAALIGFGFGIIVTDPAYSSHKRYQILVPVDNLDEFEAGPGDLEITRGEWLDAVRPGHGGVLIAIPDVQSVFHPSEIEEWTGAVVDDDTMGLIEVALTEMFEL